MSKDTGHSVFRHIRSAMRQRKKAASARGLRELFRDLGVATSTVATTTVVTNYFGVVAWGFGVVVAGLAVGAAGLVAAGFGVGAGTPDCAL